MNDLLVGTVFLGITVLLFLILRWGSRKPQEPVWLCDALVANVYTPLLIGTLTFGAGFLIKFAIVVSA